MLALRFRSETTHASAGPDDNSGGGGGKGRGGGVSACVVTKEACRLLPAINFLWPPSTRRVREKESWMRGWKRATCTSNMEPISEEEGGPQRDTREAGAAPCCSASIRGGKDCLGAVSVPCWSRHACSSTKVEGFAGNSIDSFQVPAPWAPLSPRHHQLAS